MKLFSWFTKTDSDSDALTSWRSAWRAAVEAPDAADLELLRSQLAASAAAGRDVEIELEMLDALEQLQRMRRSVSAAALPIVDTQHRVVGTEPCHFSAPASLPDDAGHASGRLLATPTRAIFIGAGRTSATAWHAVHEVVRAERDVVLVRADQSPLGHFRFNTYADAVIAAYLAQHFKSARRGRL